MLTKTTKLATTKLASQWFLTGCAMVALGSSGCRSTMPGMNLFGKRSEPSAAALAGTGPSTTYPAPPSASASPEAIASIAGGTAIPVSPGQPEASTTQFAGFETPATSNAFTSNAFTSNAGTSNAGTSNAGTDIAAATSMAAAQANGFNTPNQPAGYAFGAKAFTPKPEPAAQPAADASAYTTASSFTPPPSSYAIESKAESASTPASSGFTLPPGVSPALAVASTPPEPSTTTSTPSNFAPPSVSAGETGLAGVDSGSPGESAPSFSTASVNESIRAPSTSLSPPLPSNSSSGYSPGSTAGATGYPGTGNSAPATSGSFYR